MPTFHSIGRVHSALAEDAHGHFLGELELSNDSVSSLVFSFSSRACSLVELSHNDWVGLLKGLDISDPGVGHVALYGSTIKVFTSPASSANGLIIRAFTVSEEEVVHGTLTASHELEWLEDEVDYLL